MSRDDYMVLLLVAWVLSVGMFLWGIIFANFVRMGVV